MRRLVGVCAVVVMWLAFAPAHAAAIPPRVHELSEDTWSVRRSLDGLRPGDRVIRRLYVERIDGNTREGLLPLTRFKHLRELEITLASGVDLTPLADLHLDWLDLNHPRNVDLAPLGTMPDIGSLSIHDARDVQVPPTLTLPESLTDLSLSADGWGGTGAPVQALVEAIDWQRLGGLRALRLAVGISESLEPIHTDLSFLGSLPRLRALDLAYGVRHAGPTPSPLEPPFASLAGGLRVIEIDSWKPSATLAALDRRFPRAAVRVGQRYPYDPTAGSWTIFAPGGGVSRWLTYGSMWEVYDGRYGETEHAALRHFRATLRDIAPRLLRRLSFDQEADGTGIAARSRSDLVRALGILGVR